MRATRHRTASLATAALCLGVLVSLPGAAAACPRGSTQSYSGFLLPGEVDTFTVTLPVRGDASFQYIPSWPFWSPLDQEVTLSVQGSSMTGTGSLAISLDQAAPGAYKVRLEGHYLEDRTHIDGMALLAYQLVVRQRNCQSA